MAKKKSGFIRGILEGPTHFENGRPKYNATVQRGHHGSSMSQPREHKGVSLFSLLRLRKVRKSNIIDNR